MDDKKDKNEYDGLPVPEDTSSKEGKSLDNKGLFSYLGVIDKGFVFQYKKTEKILAALYVVTNFLSPQEPLRWEVRELGLHLLSDVMALKDALPSQKDALCGSIKTTVFEMISLLEIAHFAGFISPMNFEILKKEFIFLLDSVSNTKQSLESFVLPNNFFTEETDTTQKETNTYTQAHTSSSSVKDIKEQARISSRIGQSFKGQNNKKDSNKAKEWHGVRESSRENSHVVGRVEVKKNSRQQVIFDLLKKKKEIMVKDVASVVRDCSEKTLQRELLSMVEQGILKKEGERRWSKYSLA